VKFTFDRLVAWPLRAVVPARKAKIFRRVCCSLQSP